MRSSPVLAGCLVAVGLALQAVPAPAAPGRLGLLKPVRVGAAVDGDVVAIGADVELGPRARVRGDVIALLGRVRTAPGAAVEGRTIAIPSLAALDAAAPGSHAARTVWGFRLLMIGSWLLATSLTALLWPVTVARGAVVTRRLGVGVVVLGVLATATLFAALIAGLGMGPALAIPVTAAIVLAFLAAKIVGLSVLGTIIGSWAGRAVLRRRLPGPAAAFVGVAILLVLRAVPAVGGALWAAASVLALGSSLAGLALRPGVFARPAAAGGWKDGGSN